MMSLLRTARMNVYRSSSPGAACSASVLNLRSGACHPPLGEMTSVSADGSIRLGADLSQLSSSGHAPASRTAVQSCEDHHMNQHSLRNITFTVALAAAGVAAGFAGGRNTLVASSQQAALSPLQPGRRGPAVDYHRFLQRGRGPRRAGGRHRSRREAGRGLPHGVARRVPRVLRPAPHGSARRAPERSRLRRDHPARRSHPDQSPRHRACRPDSRRSRRRAFASRDAGRRRRSQRPGGAEDRGARPAYRRVR